MFKCFWTTFPLGALREWTRRQICIGLIVSIYVTACSCFVNIFISKEKQKDQVYNVNSDFSRTDSKHYKGPVNSYILLEFIQFTSSLPGFILSLMAYISIVAFKRQSPFLNLTVTKFLLMIVKTLWHWSPIAIKTLKSAP